MIEPAPIVHGLEQVMMDKKRKLESMEKGESKYEAAYILSSASYVEQHQSVADNLLSKRRNIISPILFEALLFLKSNSSYWSDKDVILLAIKNDQILQKNMRIQKIEKEMEVHELDNLRDLQLVLNQEYNIIKISTMMD